jgi:hypothetical protein
VVRGGGDGRVVLWDTRQPDAPVAVFEPADSKNIRDCWSVSFGDSYNDEERCVSRHRCCVDNTERERCSRLRMPYDT